MFDFIILFLTLLAIYLLIRIVQDTLKIRKIKEEINRLMYEDRKNGNKNR